MPGLDRGPLTGIRSRPRVLLGNVLTYLRAMLTARLGAERGASVTEYAILLAGVGLTLVLITVAWTHGLSGVFTFYKDDVENSDPR